jgi:hypothetical protein
MYGSLKSTVLVFYRAVLTHILTATIATIAVDIDSLAIASDRQCQKPSILRINRGRIYIAIGRERTRYARYIW